MLLFFICVAILVRFPFFFKAVIDWDESTYILTGQDILNGHLPYTHLFIAKPPLGLLGYSLFILLFGKSVIGIRIAGALCVGAASYILYRSVRRIYGKIPGILSGAFLIILSSTMGSGMATMMEHLALVPICIVIFLFTRQDLTVKDIFLMGLAIGAMSLIRRNMIYMGAASGGVLVYLNYRYGIKRLCRMLLVFIAGGMLLPALFVLIYAVNGTLDTFYRALITFAVSFVTAQENTYTQKLAMFKDVLKKDMLTHNLIIWELFVAGVVSAFTYFRGGRQKIYSSIMLILTAGVAASCIEMGRKFPHYLIHLAPFIGVFAALPIVFLKRMRYKIIAGAFIILIPLVPVLKKYPAVFDSLIKNEAFNDTAYKVADYLKRRNVRDQYIYVLHYHIIYWLTGAKVPSVFVHPQDIYKDYCVRFHLGEGATSSTALLRILDKQPRFIVMSKLFWLQKSVPVPFKKLMLNELKKRYALANEIDGILIFERLL